MKVLPMVLNHMVEDMAIEEDLLVDHIMVLIKVMVVKVKVMGNDKADMDKVQQVVMVLILPHQVDMVVKFRRIWWLKPRKLWRWCSKGIK
jgi:hypothetical protein